MKPLKMHKLYFAFANAAIRLDLEVPAALRPDAERVMRLLEAARTPEQFQHACAIAIRGEP